MSIKNCETFKTKLGSFVGCLNKIPGTVFANVSTNRHKIVIDVDLLSDVREEYLEQISNNLKISTDELQTLISTYQYKPEGGLFRISIPLLRNHSGCYCGTIFLDETYFLKGTLLFDRSFARFPITVLDKHKEIMQNYYHIIRNTLVRLNLTDEKQIKLCPYENNHPKTGHFCSACIKSKLLLKEKENRKNKEAINND